MEGGERAKVPAGRASVVALVLAVGAVAAGACTLTSPLDYLTNGSAVLGDGGHDNDGGEGGASPVVIASGQTQPGGLSLDNDNVYWASLTTGAINTVGKNGAGSRTLGTAPGSSPAVTAADGDGGASVFFDTQSGTVQKVAKAGGSPPVTIASKEFQPSGMALDAKNVYWADRNDGDAGGFILGVPKGGGAKMTVYTSPDPFTMLDPVGLTVDDAGIYWSDSILGISALTWASDGGGEAGAFNYASTSGVKLPCAFAMDDTAFYWVSDSCDPSLPLGGDVCKQLRSPATQAARVLVSLTAAPTCLAIDTSFVYWTDVNGAVQRVPKDGSAPPAKIADNQATPLDIAADANAVYWINFGSGKADGSIVKLAK